VGGPRKKTGMYPSGVVGRNSLCDRKEWKGLVFQRGVGRAEENPIRNAYQHRKEENDVTKDPSFEKKGAQGLAAMKSKSSKDRKVR